MTQRRDPDALRGDVRDWLGGLDGFLRAHGAAATAALLLRLERRAVRRGARPRHGLPARPLVNTVRPSEPFPGDAALDARVEALVRWNAAAMVARANRARPGSGGHLASFASAATLFEVGFQHFFRGFDHPEGGDTLFLQGHASPGVYARAFVEGRLDERALDTFRHELAAGGGLPSYPHPWLRPDLWETPSVSMGLAPIMAIHQARFDRYAAARGLVEKPGRVWAIVGDGEMDEPESTGALEVAGREGLSNLVLVVDGNLQRLDGPVRGGGHVLRDLAALFTGAGWRVEMCVWSSDWEPLFDADPDGRLLARLEAIPDGDWQRVTARGPDALRAEVFGGDPALEALVDGWSNADLARLAPGGHDRALVHAAYAAAEAEDARPTVVLAHTVKGYGLGAAGEALNVSHKVKDLEGAALRAFRDRLAVPIADDDLADFPYASPDETERRHAREARRRLGGPRPVGRPSAARISPPRSEAFARFLEGSGEREVTTTVALVRLLRGLLDDPSVGRRIVPIVPDEARTFGVEALFRKVGIYAPGGQGYTSVDADTLLAYRERADGQILQEGITEAGAMSSFVAAGTAYRRHQTPLLPFYFFYSMFGFQRVGDLIWAAADARARGFLIGATSGRTTLNGEGLQHQDGHSQLLAMAHPTVDAWDPAYAYELAVIVEDGIRRMVVDDAGDTDAMGLQYVTVANEPYPQPPMPEGARAGILEGMHRVATRRPDADPTGHVDVLASGVAVRTAIDAAERLAVDWRASADVWSVTSWKRLYEDASDCARRARLHPGEPPPVPVVRRSLAHGGNGAPRPRGVVAVSDWVRAVPDLLAPHVPAPFEVLGTDGFGRSDTRDGLRSFFEVDARHVTVAALSTLARAGAIGDETVARALEGLGVEADRPPPRLARPPHTDRSDPWT